MNRYTMLSMLGIIMFSMITLAGCPLTSTPSSTVTSFVNAIAECNIDTAETQMTNEYVEENSFAFTMLDTLCEGQDAFNVEIISLELNNEIVTGNTAEVTVDLCSKTTMTIFGETQTDESCSTTIYELQNVDGTWKISGSK